MSLIFLPLHVWDREFDSRLLLALLLVQQNKHVLIGHEYNMVPLFGRTENQFIFRAGEATDGYRSEWDNAINKTGGKSIIQDEEGINNIPLDFKWKDSGTIAELNTDLIADKNRITPEIIKRTTHQIAWSQIHKDYLLAKMTNRTTIEIAKSTILNGSGARFDLLGELGKELFSIKAEAAKQLFENYVLVLDNFSVDQGGKGKGLFDQTSWLNAMGYDSEEIDKENIKANDMRNSEIESREDFRKVIEQLALAFPTTVFIMRPHPAMYPGYWKESYADFKNILVIDKGSVNPWIYGAAVTIQSGCTTALEALGSGVVSIDISIMISDRIDRIKNSLASNGNLRPTNFKELKTILKNLLKQNNKKDISKSEQFIQEDCDSVTEMHLNMINKNSKSVRDKIASGLTLQNGSKIIGEDSGLAMIYQILSEGPEIKDTINYASLVKNQAPNFSKSRYISNEEFKKKVIEFITALNKIGLACKNIRVSRIATNLFLVKPAK